MSDLKLNPLTGDLLIENNDFVIIRGPDETAQRLMIKFKFFLGEWFENPALGVPWFEQILIKNPHLPTIESLLRQVVQEDESIKQVVELSFKLNAATREASLFFTAIDTNDQVVQFKEFILDGIRNNTNGL